MKTKSKGIEFDAEALVARVEGFAAGGEAAEERTVRIPRPVTRIAPRQIRAIRTRLGSAQSQFAALLNVPMVTAVSVGEWDAEAERGGAAASGGGKASPGGFAGGVGVVFPAAGSGQHRLKALPADHPRRIKQTCLDVLGFQPREIFRHVLERVSRGQHPQYMLDGQALAPNDRFSTEDRGVVCDPIKKLWVVHFF